MISVVITSCHDDKACYLTYWAARQQLGKNADYVIVADCGTEIKWEKQPVTRCLRGTFGSPQSSRDVGIKAAICDNVLVLESHVIVSDIQKLAFEHERLGGALTFPIRVAEGSEQFDVYAHETDWYGNLWYKRAVYQPVSDEPYRVAQFGNSCFMLDRRWYLESGGYTNLMKGWGGEEPFICLKAWMLGRECWQVPSVWHAHYLTAGAHAEGVNPRNFQILKYVITGEGPVVSEAIAERQRICSGPFQGDIKRLREHLRSVNAVC